MRMGISFNHIKGNSVVLQLLLVGGGDARLGLIRMSFFQALFLLLSSKKKSGTAHEPLQCDSAPLPRFDSLFSKREVTLQSHSSAENPCAESRERKTEKVALPACASGI